MYLMQKKGISEMRREFVRQINQILAGKVQIILNYKLDGLELDSLMEQFPVQVSKKANKFYSYGVEIKGFIKEIIDKSRTRQNFDFFTLLATNEIHKIMREYSLSENTQKYLLDIQNSLSPAHLMLFLSDSSALIYNVNSGTKGVPDLFRDNSKLSLGQNAVALLLIILNASKELSDNRPLIIDQPEDDLDNTYIYNTLVGEFRRSKNDRQIIISTHNPNIPVASDSENILVLKYNGAYGYLYKNGALDDPEINESVLEVLEGGEEALKKRNDKYRNIVKITM